jgi:hypothetical protein
MAWHDEDLIAVRSALVSAIAEVRRAEFAPGDLRRRVPEAHTLLSGLWERFDDLAEVPTSDELRSELMRASELLTDDGAFVSARRAIGVTFDRAVLLDRWHERHQPAA